MEELNREYIMEFFSQDNNFEECYRIISELNSYDGSLEHLDYYHNDEEFFSIFYGSNVMEVVRALCHGVYSYDDDFVKIDAYGNLESACPTEIMTLYDLYKDEIADKILELYDVWDGIEFPEGFYA